MLLMSSRLRPLKKMTERFIRIHGDSISATPMKGTIDARIPGAHRLLSSDLKEDAEHNTIVDLIRNDLSVVASKVRVKRFKYIEKLITNQGELMQMSSEITGKLQKQHSPRPGDILFKLLPAGSICGAPKRKTVEIIRKVEGHERGYYTGIFGHFDGTCLDSAVAIRYIEQQDKDLRAVVDEIHRELEREKASAGISLMGSSVTSNLDGDVEHKEVLVNVERPGGAAESYRFFLRKYNLFNKANNSKPRSRWIIADIREQGS